MCDIILNIMDCPLGVIKEVTFVNVLNKYDTLYKRQCMALVILYSLLIKDSKVIGDYIIRTKTLQSCPVKV